MPRDRSAVARPTTTARLLYVVTEDWAFLSHRLPMARAAREAGFEVQVATRVSKATAAIEAERFTLHPIPFARGSLSPFAALVDARCASPRASRCRSPRYAPCRDASSVLGMIATLGRRPPASTRSSGLAIYSRQ